MKTHSRTQLAVTIQNDPRWASVVSRDEQVDGRFYYSVETTGVYCRPSCTARLPRPENVRFYATAQAAEQAGFRACKRCRPDRYAADPEPAAQTGLQIRFSIGACALGRLLVARSEHGVCAILPGDDDGVLTGQLQQRFTGNVLVRDDTGLQRLLTRVTAFVDHPQGDLDLPLDARGSAFQQRVWQALRAIPAGTTASYAEIAQRIGAPRAVRAVAAACAANPLAVAIPCHRVIKRDGALSGYRWGVQRKRALLAREAQT